MRSQIRTKAVLAILALVPSFCTFAAEPTPPLPEKVPAAPADAPTTVTSTTTATNVKSEAPRKSQNVTINLINRLVERGVLSKEDAAELIKQAEADAEEARAQAAAIAAIQAATPAPSVTDNGTVRAPAPQSENTVADLSLEAEDTIRVPYIPESVKAQLREEIKEEVMTQAREERWAAPRTLPDWVSRFKLFADLRTRYEGDFFPDGNDNTGAFPNFNAINTGPPFDITGTTFSPQLNVDQDRHRIRLRVRFGVAADLGDNFTAGLRIATGENNSPVTTNQSLGAANSAQGGNFSKYAIWLDRGFVKYEVGGTPEADFSAWLGRFDNPWSPLELIWDDDLGFDGWPLRPV